MAQYPVLGYIKHNGDKYQAGDVIELNALEAKELIALGSISAKPLKAENKGKGDGKTGQPDLVNPDGDKG